MSEKFAEFKKRIKARTKEAQAFDKAEKAKNHDEIFVIMETKTENEDGRVFINTTLVNDGYYVDRESAQFRVNTLSSRFPHLSYKIRPVKNKFFKNLD